MKTIILVLFFIGVIVVSPLITIWSLNTLFSLSIGYTITTWLAMIWLCSITFGNIVYTIRNKK